MWIFFGTGAIVFAVSSVIWVVQRKNAKRLRFFSLSLTAFTLCAFYSDSARKVVNEDWSGLMDTMPTMSKALWICTIASIFINSISLLREKS